MTHACHLGRKQFYNVQSGRCLCDLDRSLPILIDPLALRAALQQNPDHVCMASIGSQVECGIPLQVRKVSL